MDTHTAKGVGGGCVCVGGGLGGGSQGWAHRGIR